MDCGSPLSRRRSSCRCRQPQIEAGFSTKHGDGVLHGSQASGGSIKGKLERSGLVYGVHDGLFCLHNWEEQRDRFCPVFQGLQSKNLTKTIFKFYNHNTASSSSNSNNKGDDEARNDDDDDDEKQQRKQ